MNQKEGESRLDGMSSAFFHVAAVFGSMIRSLCLCMLSGRCKKALVTDKQSCSLCVIQMA